MPTRYLLLATLLFFTYSSHARDSKKNTTSEKTNIEKQPRFSFGLMAGASFSNGKVTYYNANIATEMLIKFRFGGVAEYAATRKLFVQSGLAYTTNGYRVAAGTQITNTCIRSIELPLSLQYKLAGNSGSGPFWGAGLYYGKTLSAVEVDKTDDKTYDVPVGEVVASGMLGWSINAGYQSHAGAFVRVAWQSGFSDYSVAGHDPAVLHPYHAYSYHPYQLNLCFGFLLRTR